MRFPHPWISGHILEPHRFDSIGYISHVNIYLHLVESMCASTIMSASRVHKRLLCLISGCIYLCIVTSSTDRPPMLLAGQAILLSTSDSSYYRSSSRFHSGRVNVNVYRNGRVEAIATARRCAVAYEMYDHNGLVDGGEEYGTKQCPIPKRSMEENGTIFGPAGRRLVVFMRDVWKGAVEVGAYTRDAYERPYDPIHIPQHRYRMIEYGRSDISYLGSPAMLSCRYVLDNMTNSRVPVFETEWYRLWDAVPSPVQKHLGLNVPVRERVCGTGRTLFIVVNGSYTCEHREDATGGWFTLRVEHLSNETTGDYACRIRTASFISEESIVPMVPDVKIRMLPSVDGLMCGVRPAQDPSATATLTITDGRSIRTISSKSRNTFQEETLYAFELSNIPIGNYTCTVKHFNRSVSGTVMITDALERARVISTIVVMCFSGVYLVIAFTVTYLMFR